MAADASTSQDWLVDTTEEFCREKAIYNALIESIQICDGKNTKLDRQAIPQLLTDALAISFDSSIGHDYFEDAEKRYDNLHREEDRIPFDVEMLNTITRGGIPKKTMTILMAGVNVGKTALMCAMSASNLRDGKNVLYITLEMSEEMISQRIDANTMDLTIDETMALEKGAFLRTVERFRGTTVGKLKVKEYPNAQAGSANFRFLLNELKLKENFVPDVIYIDYLNICVSSRLKMSKSSLYEYVKAVGEEIRGLAVEFGVPIITATQFNREGFKSSDPTLDQVSDSFGTGMTADLILAIVRSEALDRKKQIMLIQLKNRLSNPAENKRFVVGFDISKMRLYNVDDHDQTLMKDNDNFDNLLSPEMVAQLDKTKSFFDDIE